MYIRQHINIVVTNKPDVFYTLKRELWDRLKHIIKGYDIDYNKGLQYRQNSNKMCTTLEEMYVTYILQKEKSQHAFPFQLGGN